MLVTSAKLPPGLAGVSETLLIPLWARAAEQSHSQPLIADPDAVRIVDELDYDFGTFRDKRVAAENFCVRSRVMDDVVAQILIRHPGTPVVEFGVGLDTRYQRIGRLASTWLEVDFAEVIELRNHFFESDSRRRTWSGSMFDAGWLDSCPTSDTPPLIVAEGVFYFFSQTQIRELLAMIRCRFPGASVVFDAVSPLWLMLSNLVHPLENSRLQFALSRNAVEIPAWDSHWTIEDYVGYGDSPWYDDVMHRFSWWKRAAVRLLPPARHAFKIVHAKDGAAAEREAP